MGDGGDRPFYFGADSGAVGPPGEAEKTYEDLVREHIVSGTAFISVAFQCFRIAHVGNTQSTFSKLYTPLVLSSSTKQSLWIGQTKADGSQKKNGGAGRDVEGRRSSGGAD